LPQPQVSLDESLPKLLVAKVLLPGSGCRRENQRGRYYYQTGSRDVLARNLPIALGEKIVALAFCEHRPIRIGSQPSPLV